MRVSDFLRRREDFDETGKKTRRRKKSHQNHRSLLSRWLFSATPAAGEGSDGAGEGRKLSCLVPFSNPCCRNGDEAEEEEEEEEKEQFATNEAAVTIPATADSVEGDRDRKPEALPFNLGLGASLIFLLAKSASEFNKMAELRSEMEMMLKCIKGEIQIQAAASNLAQSKDHSFPTSNYWESESSNKPLNDDTESCNLRCAYGTMEYHRKSNWHMNSDNKVCSKGNEMEQELQIELQRLQLNLEDQGSSMHPHQDRLEADSESSGSFNDTNQQVNEPKADAGRHAGVCPRELERRLHELLEARQHDRIAELEAALECASRKLNEKEMEVCWWRDTARLVSKHKEDRLQLQF